MPSLTALLGLIAVAGYQNRDKIAELLRGHTQGDQNQAGGAQSGGAGGLLGSLGGMLGGGGAGSMLSGGLSQLVESFTQNGHGDKAQSWISPGPNKDISPSELKQAVGPELLGKLEQQTGLSQDELMARLSRELPKAVDQYTPDGRIPNE
jgi:uncharacterized protein YidB (DUF937 family)